jgi:5-amino-6-(5-phosphoribosylamino)uracil reductase
VKRPSVRLVLAVSLDGRLAPSSGGAAQLGGAGDRHVLEQALAWSDAVLIGAGTLRAHRCTCLIRDQQLLAQRKQDGRPLQPAAFVVSRNPDFCQDWPFFQQPLDRHLLTPDLMSAEGFCATYRLQPSWDSTLVELAAMGFYRLVLLGGAGLCGSLLEADQVDELQLTLSPRLLGGRFSWIPSDGFSMPPALSQPDAWMLISADRLSGNELLVRYGRSR